MLLYKLLACLVTICLSWCIGLFYGKVDNTAWKFMNGIIISITSVAIVVSALFLVFV